MSGSVSGGALSHSDQMAKEKEMQEKLRSVLNKPKMVTMQIKTLDGIVGGVRRPSLVQDRTGPLCIVYDHSVE